MGIPIDETGNVYSRLTVLKRSERSGRRVHWDCICSCGNRLTVEGRSLRSGNTKSCGCFHTDKITTHGMTGTKVAQAFGGAKYRCQNPNFSRWSDYGGRGIEFRFDSVEDFAKELGPCPSPDHSVDRIDNDGHYEPGNIRWATRSQQQRNKRTP